MDRRELFDLEPQGAAPTGQISPQSWLSSPEVDHVFTALQSTGGTARFVGGCVRDALANRPVHDIDIATTTLPDQSRKLLEDTGARVIPTGIDHGTVTAIINDQSFEITTLREDVATDGRHATVAFTTNWYADAMRRDFTINAMSATQTGAVYDPYDGISDLAHGRIRFIGRPAERIAEDYLRILRFFRFYATHGKPPADSDGMTACRLAADKIGTLSAERIRDEMMKILGTPGLADTVLLMRGESILEHVLPEAGEVGRLRALVWLTTRAIRLDGIRHDPLLNLAALLSADEEGSTGRAVAERWNMSGAQRARLTALTMPLDTDPLAPRNDLTKYLYEHGADITRGRALLAWADEVGLKGRLPAERTAAWISLLGMTGNQTRPAFPLSGRDIIDQGIGSGPEVGVILRKTEDWWAENGCSADRRTCLDFALTLTGP